MTVWSPKELPRRTIYLVDAEVALDKDLCTETPRMGNEMREVAVPRLLTSFRPQRTPPMALSLDLPRLGKDKPQLGQNAMLIDITRIHYGAFCTNFWITLY